MLQGPLYRALECSHHMATGFSHSEQLERERDRETDKENENGWGGGRERGRKRKREKKMRETRAMETFNFKWLLAYKCLVDLGNLNKSRFRT